MPTLYRYLRCGDMRSPEVVDRRNGPLGLRDDDDDDLPHVILTTVCQSVAKVPIRT